MLLFIGLGLFDERDISVKGVEAVRAADHVFLEAYTSRAMGTSVEKLEEFFGKRITVLDRADVELHPEPILSSAENSEVAFLTGGDPMVATTHADLRLRAEARGIRTRIIHGASIASAVCGLSGLQNYRFGKSCSIPYPEKGWFPTTPIEIISANLASDLHTIVYLDIRPDRFMTVPEAIALLEEMAERTGIDPPRCYVGIARAGSDEPVVIAGTGTHLKDADFGPPLHILVVPATLHPVEREYLEVFGAIHDD